MRLRSILFACVAALALTVPAAAAAKQRRVLYVFNGTYTGRVAGTHTSSVHVLSGNKYVKRAKLIGTEVSFDLAKAEIDVTDPNHDGKRNLSDVAVGDRVVVRAMLGKRDPGNLPFRARRLVDLTHRPH